MPKLQRSQEEIIQAKTDILEKAAQLIVDIGYNDFTMRKLAEKLKITATTIYNYFKNKDDLFISLLIMGFSDLYADLVEAGKKGSSPAERLRAMIAAYTDFGLNNANFYNLMYAWHVPKYNTYAGTDLEPVARRQLEIAMKIPDIFLETIKAYARDFGQTMSDENAVFLLIHYWSQIHGFIAGCNNTNLSYIHRDPLSLKERHLTGIADKFRNDVIQTGNQGE
ncbi:MAG: TetR/AcrR family transcriptional regulator [Desulfobacteraceae bacterium]|jgi:AcrR family transcriptional regulator